MIRSAIIMVLSAGIALLAGQSITSVEAGCRWVGTAPKCGGKVSDCRANEDFIEYAGTTSNSQTGNSRAKFGSPCSLGGGKVLCCTKEAPIGDAASKMGKAIQDVTDQAVVLPPPPCPEGEMRIKGKCQVPPLKPGTSKDASGFLQMFPTCASGKTYDQDKKACVANVPAAKMCSVGKPGAVYDRPQGDKALELAANTRDVTLLGKSGANWFNVKWPGGQGWVYSGPGYENAISCP